MQKRQKRGIGEEWIGKESECSHCHKPLIVQSVENSDTKACPFCAEQIQINAIKCKHILIVFCRHLSSNLTDLDIKGFSIFATSIKYPAYFLL